MVRRTIWQTSCLVIAWLVGGLWVAAPVFAASAAFGQKILPLNCVFEQVNDGTGTIIYLTPAACGQVITPPPSGNAPDSVTIAADSSQQFNTNREVFLVPGPTASSGNFTNAGVQLPWQPIATLGSRGQKGVGAAVSATPKLSTTVVAGTIAGIALVIVLVVFIF
jgi:hypothetical protein